MTSASTRRCAASSTLFKGTPAVTASCFNCAASAASSAVSTTPSRPGSELLSARGARGSFCGALSANNASQYAAASADAKAARSNAT